MRSLSAPTALASWALLASIGASSSGCAPSLDHLLHTRQYGEALCAVTLPDQAATEAERQRVMSAFVAESDPQLFLRALTREELEASLGPRGTQFHRDFVVIVVGFADNHVQLDGATSVRFVLGGQPLSMVDANDAAFAVALHEQLPGDKTIVEKEGRIARLGRALLPEPGKGLGATAGGVATGMLELLTLGIVPFTEIFPGKKPDRVTVIKPTDAQIRAAAPATMTVHDGLAQALREVPRTWEPNAVLLERPHDGGIPIVQVERRLVKTIRSGGSCRATVVFEQPLLPAPTLEESVARTFPGPVDAPRIGGTRAVQSFETRRVSFPPQARGVRGF